MKDALEKLLNNFVIGDNDISYYEIENHPTDEDGVLNYVVAIYVPLDIDMKDADAILDRLKTAFSLLGFTRVNGNIFGQENWNNLLIRGRGHIKKEEQE